MKRNIFWKELVFSIIVMFVGTSMIPAGNSASEQQSISPASSQAPFIQNKHIERKDQSQTPLNGLAPHTKQKPTQTIPRITQSTLPGGRGEFYAYNAYDPNGMNSGEITFDNSAVVNLIGSGSGISFITGEDIDWDGNCYGVTYNGGLYSIDLYTGDMTFIAYTIPLNSLVLDGVSGIWYASGSDWNTWDGLWTIDITTGATTYIGSYGINNIMISIMMDEYGNMYGYDVLWGGNSHLYSINKSTGTATPIGDMGHNFCYAQEGKFDKVDNTLYLAAYDIGMGQSYLATCDPETAEVTIINEFIPWGIQIDGLALPWAWLTPGVGVKKIIAPVSGDANIITPEIIIQNYGWFDVNNLPVNMTIVKRQYTGFLHEDFNKSTFPPAGWNNLGTTDYWVQSSSNYAGGTSPEAILWYYNNYGGSAGLQSPFMDTSSATSLQLSFRSTISWSGGPCECTVEVTDDGGTSWHDISPWVNPVSVSQGNRYEVDISAYKSTQTGIRFIYSGQYSWLNFWALDDVIMFDQIVEYNQTLYTDVPAWMTLDIVFPDWTPADLGVSTNVSIEYVVNATTDYYGNNRPDFYKQKIFTLHFGGFHNVVITQILSPTSGRAHTVSPEVVIENQGQNDETASINMVIGKATNFTTILQEDFSDGVPPLGWGTDAPTNWLISQTIYAGGTSPEAKFEPHAWLIGDFHLFTPVMNTSGWIHALLTFRDYVFDKNGQYTLKIQTSNDGGTIWYDAYVRPGGNYGPQVTQIILGTGNGIGSNTFQISFTYSGDSWNIHHWYIDDVCFGQIGIENEYNQSINVGIGIGESVNVPLPEWTPIDLGAVEDRTLAYIVTVMSHLNENQNSSYDVKHKTFTQYFGYFHDVALTAINSPQSGQAETQSCQVLIENLGQYNESLNVNMSIGRASYATLFTENFSSSVPPPGWGTDAPQHWQSHQGNNAGGIAPEALFFWVPFEIGEFHLYTPKLNTTGWTNALLTFKDYVWDNSGQYTLKIQTSIDGGTTWNDVYRRTGGDYGPQTTRVTLDTIDGIGANNVMISWTFSGNTEDMQAWCIDDVWFGQINTATEYSQNINVSINAGLSMNVTLPDWTPADVPMTTNIDYLIDASASMNVSDENSANNELTKLITLNYSFVHDVGVTEITEPDNPQYPGTYHLSGIVKNFGGTYHESNFPVEAKITHVVNSTIIYDQTTTITGPLAPGQTTLVTFPDFTLANLTEWEGIYEIEMWTTLPGDDHPDNDKDTMTFTMVISDILPPITTYNLTGTMGLNNWYVSNVAVTLRAYDPYPPLKPKSPSGINHTYYSFDNATWTEYTTPVIVSIDGNYELYYYSTDKAGNTETPKGPFQFKIDKTKPSITLTATALNLLKDRWLLNATATDEMSNIARVEFYVDAVFVGNISAPGPYVIEYDGHPHMAQAIAYDNAGNFAISAPVYDYQSNENSQPNLMTNTMQNSQLSVRQILQQLCRHTKME
jgi:hypothetical protein